MKRGFSFFLTDTEDLMEVEDPVDAIDSWTDEIKDSLIRNNEIPDMFSVYFGSKETSRQFVESVDWEKILSISLDYACQMKISYPPEIDPLFLEDISEFLSKIFRSVLPSEKVFTPQNRGRIIQNTNFNSLCSCLKESAKESLEVMTIEP